MENKKINKITLAQLNPISGDISYNKNKAINAINKAISDNSELIIFPELFLIGAPFGDILKRYKVIEEQINKSLSEFLTYSTKIKILIGYVEDNKSTFALIQDNKIVKISKNSKENRILELNNYKYYISFFDELNLIESDDIDGIICPISSTSRLNKLAKEHEFIKNAIKKLNRKVICVNLVGANDEAVFNGFSRIYSEFGEIKVLQEGYQEDILTVDINNIQENNIILPNEFKINHNFIDNFSLSYDDDLERTYNTLILGIRDYFNKSHLKRAVLGLSGGLDSTICATLLADAIGSENVLGISMPSKLTSSDSKNDAKELSDNLKINFIEIPIKDMHVEISNKFQSIFHEVESFYSDRYKKSFTEDNIQARSRATILWGVANEFPSMIPIATSDKSELYMGYATVNGDMSGGFAPIADVTKTKLFALARYMNENRIVKNAIPNAIILKPPGAELAIDPKTGKTLLAEDALMPYEFLDEVIWRIENLNQSVDNMMKSKFLYEKKYILDEEKKKEWLNKFFKRLNTALYKWCILPTAPIVDSHSINKNDFHQPIISNIDY